jgi:tetratricopeptide (TPR) repeat protein
MKAAIKATTLALIFISTTGAGLIAQNTARQRALTAYRLGFENMRAEAFDEAAQAFEAATQIDPTFEMAHYMLGRANMLRKRFVEAVDALTKAQRLYRLQSGRQFENAQEAQRYRRDSITEIDEYLRQLQTGRQTAQTAEQIRLLTERKRQLLETISRGNNMTLQLVVPSYVSLSLGSAYFRTGNLAEAEKAYLDAIAADPKAGEAHNNLAVVYLETGRLDEAEKAIRAAEQAGIKVHPQLKADIAARRK